MKTHWLYGQGPNKEVKFNIEIDKEDKCATCTHNVVCSHNMEIRCGNYEFGTSTNKGCHGCIHRYTRWDGKDSIPCFKCNEYDEDKESVSFYFDIAEDLSDLNLTSEDILAYVNMAKNAYLKDKIGENYTSKGSKNLPKVPYEYIIKYTRDTIKEIRDRKK